MDTMTDTYDVVVVDHVKSAADGSSRARFRFHPRHSAHIYGAQVVPSNRRTVLVLLSEGRAIHLAHWDGRTWDAGAARNIHAADVESWLDFLAIIKPNKSNEVPTPTQESDEATAPVEQATDAAEASAPKVVRSCPMCSEHVEVREVGSAAGYDSFSLFECNKGHEFLAIKA